MFLAILSLITALSISAVAIYYSVAGLVAIFAAAAIPIIIMGGVLEIGKLVTAVWLHKYWDRATWWLKTYLSAAVIILMFITSMGIFGFLSKAHIEQTSAAGEGVAQIEQIEKTIAGQQAIIARAEQIIETTQTSGTGADQNIQSQIDREQQRIDTAYDRVQPAIDATRTQLEGDKKFYLNQLPSIDEKLQQFEVASNIDTTDEEAVKRLQALVGARPDGAYGGGTARAVKAYKESLEAERTDILAKVEELKAKSQEEIARLRSRAEAEIDDSNKLIGRLRSQLGTSTGEDIDAIIDDQNARIKAANLELDTLTEEKFGLEAEYRKLEAEVGPIKYIAEFIYGEQADKNLLEEAVRWVIIVIIIVFDPLAVLLLIASQYTFGYAREDEDNGESTTDNGAEEDPPEEPDGPPTGGNTVSEEQDSDTIQSGDPDATNTNDDGATSGTDPQSEEPVAEEQGTDTEDYVPEPEVKEDFSEEDPISREEKQDPLLTTEEVVESYIPEDDSTVEKKDTSSETVESTESTNNWRPTYTELIEPEKKDKNSKQHQSRLELYLEKDKNLRGQKQIWKEAHPNETIKIYKAAYIDGKIDKLPWEGYSQNSEQSENSLFSKIRQNGNKD